jgi:hypothetical protein
MVPRFSLVRMRMLTVLSLRLSVEMFKLKRADLKKPSYEEYWPNIEGLAQRERVTDEIMSSIVFSWQTV